MEHGTEADRAAIAELIAAEDAAWTNGDAVAYSRAVATDCVFTNIFGAVFVGHPGFEEQHARIFSTVFRGTRLRQTIDHMRFVRPDVAIVNTSAELTGVQAFPPGVQAHNGLLLSKLLQVFVKENGAWEIASYHNVDVKAPPPMPKKQ
jgi:uncharacterized protein (TIGR02246 family)